MVDNSGSQNKESYADFCKKMTAIAENQLDYHRSTYYPICVSYFLTESVVSLLND